MALFLRSWIKTPKLIAGCLVKQIASKKKLLPAQPAQLQRLVTILEAR